MPFLRSRLAQISRNLVLRRSLPEKFGGRELFVTPGAALAYYHRLNQKRWGDLFDFAEYCVNPGDCIWDIGANLGVFAFAAAQRAGENGEVCAVEADPWLAHLIRRSAQKKAGDAAVAVLCAAIAADNTVQSFSTPERARSGSHLGAVCGAGETLVGKTSAEHPVVTVGLDWLMSRLRKPDAVKIDIEGAELLALQGASKLLAECRPRLLLEVNEVNVSAVTVLLEQNRYDLYDFSQGWKQRSPVKEAVYHTLALPRAL